MKKTVLFIFTLIFTAIAQGQEPPAPAPPTPSGPPAPPCAICPPGTPIDENIYIGFAVAVVLGFLFLCHKVKNRNALHSDSDI